ncbi:MAG: HEAT repeat domain-containing protein [Gemmatimonadetes bacterium]|nr:HEAT repeat domain-containing protein [Gemmatimonadota bacterium]
MLDPARYPLDPAGTAEAEDEHTVGQVTDLLVAFGKALRAHQLYDVNNPVYQRFLGALRASFAQLWSVESELSLAVSEDALTWNGREIYRNDNRAEALSFLLHKDGIRALTFSPGFEQEEVAGFLEVLHRARHLRTEEDDLLTLLWERDFANVRYTYVDLFAEGAATLEATGEPPTGLTQVLESELEAEAPAEAETGDAGEETAAPAPPPAARKITREDFDATLYFLGEDELHYVQQEIEREGARDLRADVLAALFDRLEDPNRPRQSEILGIFRTLLPNFLGRGALAAVASVLRELDGLVRRKDVFDQERERDVEAILDELSSPATIAELVRAIEVGALTPSVQELGEFLRHLRHGALGPLIRASEEMRQKDLKSILGQAVERIAQTHRDALLAHLEADDPVVAAGTARLVGRLGLSEAVARLGRLLQHADANVRLAAVDAAVALRSGEAADVLVDALNDPVRDVRIAAVRGLGAVRHEPAWNRLRDIVEGKAIREADLTEKIAFFEAFGNLGGPDGVDLLDRLLNGRGFLGRRESSEIRACAALALGRVRTAEATRSLQAAASDEDPIVRSAVTRALRGEG